METNTTISNSELIKKLADQEPLTKEEEQIIYERFYNNPSFLDDMHSKVKITDPAYNVVEQIISGRNQSFDEMRVGVVNVVGPVHRPDLDEIEGSSHGRLVNFLLI